MKEPIGVALANISNRVVLLVTDPSARCIWTVEVTSIVSPKRGGGDKPVNSSLGEEDDSGAVDSTNTSIQQVPKKMTLISTGGEGVNFVDPCGISFDSEQNELFVTLRQEKKVLRLTMGTKSIGGAVAITGHVELLASALPGNPME
jgi:hypothetical protein